MKLFHTPPSCNSLLLFFFLKAYLVTRKLVDNKAVWDYPEKLYTWGRQKKKKTSERIADNKQQTLDSTRTYLLHIYALPDLIFIKH